MDEKKCSTCGDVKPLGEFNVKTSSHDGHCAQCKVCRSTARKASYKANPEKDKARSNAYYRSNTKKVRAKWAADYKANPEKFKAISAANYRTNPEKIRARVAAWVVANPEVTAIAHQRRRDLDSKNDAGISDTEMRETIRDANNMALGICAYCFKPFGETAKSKRTVDHVIPRTKGGRTVPENVVIACLSCNSKKGNRSTFSMLNDKIQPEPQRELPPETPERPFIIINGQWHLASRLPDTANMVAP